MNPMYVVLCLAPTVLCIDITLDQHCFSKMPSMQRAPLGRFGIRSLILICSDVDAFSQCILKYRTKNIDGVHVELFEEQFPERFDLYRAGYVFCSEEFPSKSQSVITFTEDETNRCEYYVDFRQCQGESFSYALQEALRKNDTRDIVEYSCTSAMKYYRCLRDQYTKCNGGMGFLFTYHFARLGADCVALQNEFNTVVMEEYCTGSSRSCAAMPELQSWAKFAGLLIVLISYIGHDLR